MFCWFNDRVSLKQLKSLSTTHRYLLQLFTITIGIALSVYLLIQHTELKSGIQDTASFCSLSSFADCDVVNASDYAEVVGIPIAGFGALFYFALLAIGLLFPPGSTGYAWGQGQMGRLALLGLVVDIYLLLIQLFVLGNLCVMCFLTYVATALVFLLSFLAAEKKKANLASYLKMLLGPKFAAHPQIQLSHFVLATIALVVFGALISILPSTVRMRSQSYELVNRAMDQYFEQWKELPIRKFPVKDGDGTQGAPTAKVQIVEFSDYECPHCRKAAFTLNAFKKNLGNQVQFVFKNFPLDSSCNPSLKMQKHPHACALARLAFCADKKGKFWDFHDQVFFQWNLEDLKSKNAVSDAVKDGVLSSLFTEKEAQDCLASGASLNNVAEDIRLGAQRDVDGTPAVFVNGKRVTIPLSLENLRRLVEIESKL